LELGSGTGSVTEAILDRGVPPSQLVAVESDEDFAHVLRERFKESRIVEGNAFHLEGLLQRIGWEQAFGSIVSGIPILTEPLHVRRAFLCTVMRWLKPHAPFIQFSYGSSPPLPLHDEVRVHHAEKVWEPFVPMHIWVYRVGTATRR
jgi:phosphatidylethanolamine/phosphatidyl-N-methylethanolamine N-methyltransferase